MLSQLTVHGSARPLPAAVDLAAYRIIQEALTNVLRHAGACTVQLDLRYNPQVVIRIADDGTAASPGQAGTNGQDGHWAQDMERAYTTCTVHRRPAPRRRLPGAVRVTHPRPGMMTTCAR